MSFRVAGLLIDCAGVRLASLFSSNSWHERKWASFPKCWCCAFYTRALTCGFHEILTPIWASERAEVDFHCGDVDVTHRSVCAAAVWHDGDNACREEAGTTTPQYDRAQPQKPGAHTQKKKNAEMMSFDLGKCTFRLWWLIYTLGTRAHSGTQFNTSEIHSATGNPIRRFGE